MECGRRVFAGSDMTLVLQNDNLPGSSEVLNSLWISDSPPSFHGDSASCSNSMVNFENISGENPTPNGPLFPTHGMEENGNEDYDVYFHKPEKKRRLRVDQVQFLEKNFKVENKLEPERKAQLAKELGLQPRQVAIWFQNRRARFKTKHLEKEYGSLKDSYDKLKADHDCLIQERERLRNQVLQLKEELLEREKQSSTSHPDGPNNQTGADDNSHRSKPKLPKLESDRPHCAEGNHSSSSSSQLEPADSSSPAFGPDQSDFSQGEEEDNNLSKGLLHPPCFPKLEEGGGYYIDPSTNCCNCGFPVEDQPSWLWPY